MNHSFQPIIGHNKCTKCGRVEIDHTEMATCEACTYVGICTIYNDMLLCPECIQKEELLKPMPEENPVIIKSRSIDYAIQVKEEIFNAETKAIVELKEAIDSDETITDKHYTLSIEIQKRYNHFAQVIYSKQYEIQTAANQQRADQTYLNQLTDKLTLKQRNELKLKDMTYTPMSKPIAKPKTIKTAPKFDKHELVRCANESGFPMQALQMICIKRGITPQEAVEELKKAVAGLK